MKIKVYHDGYPNSYYYEYKPVSAFKLPAVSHIHFVKEDLSPYELICIQNEENPLAALEVLRANKF